MNDFFPTEDYKLPTSSNYMRFQEGENNFRVLSSTIVGWEYFNTSNKPVRSRECPDNIPEDIKPGGFVKVFWAFIVWNYDEKKIQILELTQKSIMSAIQALVRNTKWGTPKEYDITVTRTGSGLDTEYLVQPTPHSKLDPKIAEMYKAKSINLEKLYTGADPFVA